MQCFNRDDTCFHKNCSVLLIYTAVGLHTCTSLDDEEGWTLVYKIETGGNGSAYDLFMSNESLNVYDEEAMSLNCSKSPSKKHFKSDIVNYWSIIEIHQVRVSVYVSGIEQVFLLFNGSETNKTNWFDKSRLINSSYSDLNEKTNNPSFSVDGIYGSATNADYTGFYSRRFYIRYKTEDGHCITSDYGWLLVGDAPGNCGYERNIKDKPFILFSNPPTISKALNHSLADSFAIFIKFSSKANFYGNSQCITNTAHISTNLEDPALTSSTSTTITSEDLQNKIDKIKMELTVQRKSTQKYRRSLTSAPDERASSKLMGIIGGTFILSVVGLIVLLDCATCNIGRKIKAKKGNN